VKNLTVSEKFNDYAKSVEQKILAQNIRVTTDLRNEKNRCKRIRAKYRCAEKSKRLGIE
jgi:threonyl-tRNA synthetase